MRIAANFLKSAWLLTSSSRALALTQPHSGGHTLHDVAYFNGVGVTSISMSSEQHLYVGTKRGKLKKMELIEPMEDSIPQEIKDLKEKASRPYPIYCTKSLAQTMARSVSL